MINEALLSPRSIVVVGGSDDVHKPGGKILKNLREHAFRGELRVANPRHDTVQGIPCCRELGQLPQTDLAILAVKRALFLHAAGGPRRWDKTHHIFPVEEHAR
jgi:acetyltransferase